MARTSSGWGRSPVETGETVASSSNGSCSCIDSLVMGRLRRWMPAAYDNRTRPHGRTGLMTGPDRHRDTEAPRARHGFRDAPGRPLRYALDDWRTLIRLRESYARDLLAGKKPHLVLAR